jgi:hypothetical protein
VTNDEDFLSSLTPDESSAIEWWLNLGSRVLRDYRATGERPIGCKPDQFKRLLENFDSALMKAPMYSGLAYRGAAASPLWSDSLSELRALIVSEQDFEVQDHLSASISEEIGIGHCHTEPDDQPREISVLHVFRVQTARLLPGFVHRAKDEQEIVITRGSRFKRLSTRQLPSPRDKQEFWRIDLEQVA